MQYCLRPEIGKVEIAPFAYMRGRTFENAVVILDEAQNVTAAQMKMFLTRLGGERDGHRQWRYHPVRFALWCEIWPE